MSKYPYGTEVDLWYVDADATDVERMVKEFQVDSSKIEYEDDPDFINDGRPTPDEIEKRDDWLW